MLSLPQKTLDKVKKYLLRRQKQVEEQLQSIDRDDPVSMAEVAAEAPESGTDSWQAEAHGRLATLKNDLLDLSYRIKDSLLKLRGGTYGHCGKCGIHIEAERLEAMPTATLCIKCSQKSHKK